MAGGIIGSLMYAVGFKFNSRGLDTADKKVGLLTKSVIGIGAAAGTAMIGIGLAGLHAASEFENAMTQIQNATGSTADQMESTRKIAKDLYSQNFGENWQDLGSGIASVQQITRQTGKTLEDTTRYALVFKNVFGVDVPESARAAKTMIENFGISSEQAFNLMAQGTQKGLDFSGELLDSLDEYSLQFKSLGFDANEMFDTLAAGAKNGAFNVDKVADAVKEFGLRSKDGSKTTVQSFQMLGLDADKMMKTFAAGGPKAKESFTQITQMIEDIEDPVAQNTIAVNLFGTQFEDLQKNVITAMGHVDSQFDMTKKTMDELNKTKFTSLGQVFGFIGRQVEVGFLIPLGQKLLPYLDQFGQWVTSHQPQITALGKAISDGVGLAIGKVSGWVQAAIPFLQQFGTQAGQAFGYLVDKGKELWTNIQPVVELIGTKLVDAAVALWPEIQNIAAQSYKVSSEIVKWEPFIPIVSGLAAAFLTYKMIMLTVSTATKIAGIATKTWSAITKAFTAVQLAFNAVLTMNPIMLIVLALVALVVALVVAYKRSDKFRAFIDKMWAGIKTATSATLKFFTTSIPAAFNSVVNFVVTWSIKIYHAIVDPISFAVNAVKGWWNKMLSDSTERLTAIWNVIKSVWNSISSTVSGAANGIWGAVTRAWDNVKGAISTAMEAVKGTMSGAWDSIVGAVSGVGSQISSTLSGAWDGVKNTFAGAINWIIQKFNNMLGSLNSISIKNPFTGEEIAGVSIPLIPLIDGSHANGLSNVPWDGYIAELHKDERVLTADENKDYSRYTPESAPARATNNQKGNVTAPVININILGNADANTVQQIGSVVDQKLQDFLDAAARILGVEISGAN